MFDECVFLLFFIQVDKMSARNKKLEDEVSTDLSTVAWSTTVLEALFLLVSYFFIAPFDDRVFLLFFVQVAKMSARNKKLEDEVSTDLTTVAWSTKMLEALFLLVSYFFIATFDDCVFLLFFVQVDKMSPRNKKLEDEVSKDLSNEDW